MKKYEQALKLTSELEEAIAEVNILKTSKKRKQTFNDFIDEL